MPQTFWQVLARAWGAAAFFHPLVQEDGRAWEEALVAVLTEAEAAAAEPSVSPNQLRVLQTLLASLEDGATRLIIGPAQERRGTSAHRPLVTREILKGNIAYVRVQHWFDFRIGPGYFTEWHDAIRSLNDAIEGASAAGASALILDFRETGGDVSEDAEKRMIYGRMRADLVAHLIEAPAALPGLARVQRVGYHDAGNPGGQFGAYATEWVTQVSAGPILPVASAFAGPLAILTARDTSSLLEPALILLQRTGRAIGIGEQSLAYHANDEMIPLADDLFLQLRRYALLSHDRPARYRPDVPADDALATALAVLGGERPPHREAPSHIPPPAPAPPPDGLPSREQRLLAVVKLWTAVRTFYPYQEYLAGWDESLPSGIADAAAAPTYEAYFQACQRLLSRCKGGHNFVVFQQGERLCLANRPHGFAPRIRLARIQGAVTVAGPVAPGLPTQPGEVLEAVGGEAVVAREGRLRPLFTHYPSGAIDHYLLPALLDSPEGAPVRLRVRSASGQSREVDVVADGPVDFVTEPIATTTLPPWGLLSGEFDRIGYLDASRVDLSSLDAALRELATAAALIVDLRRYPTLPGPLVSLRQFMRHPTLWPPQRRPVVAGPEQGIFGWLDNRFYPTDVIPPASPADERPMAALVGGGTVSLGEDWAYTLRTACGAMLVGSGTAGGFGANAFVGLPGGGRASFSGSYAPQTVSGTLIEGNGLVPDMVVESMPGDDRDAAMVAAARALLGVLNGLQERC